MRTPSTKKFLAWLEAQPALRSYEYYLNCNCAITQFLRANGAPEAVVGASAWFVKGGDGKPKNLPRKWDVAVFAHPRTFGEAAARLRSS